MNDKCPFINECEKEVSACEFLLICCGKWWRCIKLRNKKLKPIEWLKRVEG